MFQVLGCAISPDGTLLATASDDKSVCIINIATQAKVYTARCDGFVRVRLFSLVLTSMFKVYGVAWSTDGTRLVAVTINRSDNTGSVVQVTSNKSHSIVYKNKSSV